MAEDIGKSKLGRQSLYIKDIDDDGKSERLQIETTRPDDETGRCKKGENVGDGTYCVAHRVTLSSDKVLQGLDSIRNRFATPITAGQPYQYVGVQPGERNGSNFAAIGPLSTDHTAAFASNPFPYIQGFTLDIDQLRPAL